MYLRSELLTFVGRSVLASPAAHGWPDNVVSASSIAWSGDYATPRALSIIEIKDVVKAFGDAATRAVKAGVDSIELHAAHGYLIHQFMSTASNKRTDEYGGSFENRIKIVLEAITEIRSRIPEDMPFFVRFVVHVHPRRNPLTNTNHRVSGTDWLDATEFPGAWDIEQTIRLAKLLYPLGVDLLDVSSGGNHPNQKILPHNEYQIDLAGKVRKALDEEGGEAAKLLISAVGGIVDGVQANNVCALTGLLISCF